MTRPLRGPANWLIPCALVGAMALGLPQPSKGADDSHEWLEKMNRALATRNYDGTFFHISGGRVETMRTEGGHRLVDGAALARFAVELASTHPSLPVTELFWLELPGTVVTEWICVVVHVPSFRFTPGKPRLGPLTTG